MKRMLIAGALALAAAGQAFAADLPMPGPPVPPAAYMPVMPVYNWTGFYLGVNGGGAFGTSTDQACCGGSFSANGALVGGTIGGNYQMGAFVLGIEADGDWTNLDGQNSTTCGNCETKSNWLATVRGRAGYAWDRVLFYGTAGGAFANVQAGSIGGPFDGGTQVGWTAGAGVEYAFLPNWTAKVEYLFVDLGNLNCTPAGCGGGFPGNAVNLAENVVRGGINFKFGW
jgi:outer membrane immunogenic protein